MTPFRKVSIAATGSAVPERIVTNHELAQQVSTTDAWIRENLGIEERRIAGPEERTSDLAARAGLDALARAGLKPADVELLIVATATPDRAAPSTACITQHKMGIGNGCPAFDIAAVCSGFLYAMTIAAQFIESGQYRTVLVIGADTFSKITDWTDRSCVFFGDGAGAVVMRRSSDERALFSSLLHADGAGMDNFTVYPQDATFTMNGRAVYDTGTTVLPQAVSRLLHSCDFTIKDVRWVIPHQPSIRILHKTAELLELPRERMKTNMQRYANTAAATIPLLLDETHKAGELQSNDLLVFAAVGSGWTWGAAVLRWL